MISWVKFWRNRFVHVHVTRYSSYIAISIAAIGLIILSVLGYFVQSKLSQISAAQNDNTTWVVAQLQVDYLNLTAAVQDAMLATDDADQRDIAVHAIRSFDIYYSRISVVRARLVTLEQRIDLPDNLSRALRILTVARTEIAETIDSAPAPELVNFQRVSAELEELHRPIRDLTVTALQSSTELSLIEFESQRSMIYIFLSMAIVMVVLLSFIGIIAVSLSRDLTRRNHEVTLAGAMLRSVVDSSLDAIIVTDVRGEIQNCNASAISLFGFQDDSLIGRNLQELLVRKRSSDIVSAELQTVAQGYKGRLIDNGRARMICKRANGEEFVAEVAAVSNRTADRQTTIVAFIRDITQKAAAEKLERQAKLAAERTARSKERFHAIMSHELRTPLHGIIAALDLMRDLNLSDDAARLMTAARVSADGAVQQIEEALEASFLDADARTGTATEDVFDPVAIMQAIVQQMGPAAQIQKSHIVTDTASWSRQQIIGHTRAFHYALVNLVRNATKFTSHGKIVVRMKPSDSQSGYLRVEVEDNGIGIAPEDQLRIFEDFESGSADSNFHISGTGLGLGIVQKAVAAMNGTLGLESKLHKGSIFWFEVPARQSDVALVHPVQHKAICKGLKSLVVDDNDINRFVLDQMMQRLGCHVETASTGSDAVNLAQNHNFDLILMDLNMPGMDGHTTIKHIREYGASRHARIFIVTAHIGVHELARAPNDQHDGILLKPVTLGSLISALTENSRSVASGPARVEAAEHRVNLIDDAAVAALEDVIGRKKTQDLMSRALTDTDDALHAAQNRGQDSHVAAAEKAHYALGSLRFIGAIALGNAMSELEDALRAVEEDILDSLVAKNWFLHSQTEIHLKAVYSDVA